LFSLAIFDVRPTDHFNSIGRVTLGPRARRRRRVASTPPAGRISFCVAATVHKRVFQISGPSMTARPHQNGGTQDAYRKRRQRACQCRDAESPGSCRRPRPGSRRRQRRQRRCSFGHGCRSWSNGRCDRLIAGVTAVSLQTAVSLARIHGFTFLIGGNQRAPLTIRASRRGSPPRKP